MGGARALIASLGASISLVAGAALSLLVVSFVFAYDGLAGVSYDGAGSLAQVVVVPGSNGVPSGGRDARSGDRGAVVIAAPARRPAAEQRLATRKPAAEGLVQPRQAIGVVGDVDGAGRESTPTTTSRPDQAAGDGVRELGGAVTATVEESGAAAGSAAAPLGPPVSQAVQEVLNLLNGIIEGATGGLPGALDPTSSR